MSITSLVAFVDADGSPEKQVHLAADLADRFSATLLGLSAIILPPPVVANGVVLFSSEAYVTEFEAKLAAREKWFRHTAAGDRRQVEWRQALNLPVDMLAREARCADLVVIGQTKDPGATYISVDPGDVVLQAGRPTLVVPDGVDSLRAEHIVIGWKDTRESRRAVQDALPLLHRAKNVSIVEICDPNDEKASSKRLDDVALYLKRHNVNSHPKVVQHQEGSGAKQLIRFAQDERADLLVTGAYGHSRVGEWIFGGMTRDLLASSPMCCLMSY